MCGTTRRDPRSVRDRTLTTREQPTDTAEDGWPRTRRRLGRGTRVRIRAGPALRGDTQRAAAEQVGALRSAASRPLVPSPEAPGFQPTTRARDELPHKRGPNAECGPLDGQ